MGSFKLKEFRSSLGKFMVEDGLPDEDEVLKIGESAVNALEKEKSSYRPYGHKKTPGGLLDFSDLEQDVILVPDLHARPEFLLRLLDSEIVGQNVLSALADDKCTVLCVGDCFHTETSGRCAERWKKAWIAWNDGEVDSPMMREEMHDCFATLLPIMMLKNAFPKNFHFLKGNHENILNENDNGNYSFRKHANEGQMVFDFVEQVYSQATLHILNSFEKTLPIVALFKTFAVSHAEPYEPYSREEIIDYRRNPSVILNFTWTDNGEAREGSVIEQLRLLDKKIDAENFLWFGGHRPVKGRYALRQDGQYIQFHNPTQMNVVHVHADGSFNIEKDIVSVMGE
ncbi:MAG: metallophosphoesterase [Treponema sp.]|nr:metallophosphoesterase [Treponema sp.]